MRAPAPSVGEMPGMNSSWGQPSSITLGLLLALLISTIFWVVAWYGDTALRMVGVWWHSETFAHGLIIYPVSVWLIWRNRSELASLPVEPCFGALIPLGLLGFAWLVGELGGVDAARQFALVATLHMVVWTLVGTRVAKAIAFPLAFTLLAVPVGEFMLPVLMEHTADFTVAALRLTGIPVYREGLYFTVPSGQWSVVEACSGLRYLIASITLGFIYGYLSYRSIWRRVLFICASVIVPIVANWFRAYMIVMIGHLSGMKYAVGVDHLIYGWIFFGVVMLILFWVGSFWREDGGGSVNVSTTTAAAPVTRSHSLGRITLAAIGVAFISIVSPLYSAYLESNENEMAWVLNSPPPAGQWQYAESKLPEFRPHFLNASVTLQKQFEAGNRQVGLFIAYYGNQREGAELIGYGNEIVTTSDRVWQKVSERFVDVAGTSRFVETKIRNGGTQLVVLHAYWVGGKWVARKEEVKLKQAFDRLRGKGGDAAVVAFYAPMFAAPDENMNIALRDFALTMLPSVSLTLENVRNSPSADAIVRGTP